MKFAVAAALLAAAVVQLADASCPNQCSGHGRCGAFDKCECFKSAGLNSPYRYGYTGPDCSLRMCPSGRAYGEIGTASSGLTPVVFTPGPGASSKEKLKVQYSPGSRTTAFTSLRRDQTFVVRIMSVVESDATICGTFTWKLEEDEYFEAESAICASQTDTSARALTKIDASGNSVATGVSVFWDPTYKGSSGFTDGEIAVGDEYRFTLPYNEGITFDEGNSNTAHQETVCSSRGTCDFNTGKCHCLKGYTGSACERTECPHSCSGHGTCQPQSRFVADANVGGAKYKDAYDGNQQYGCKCDVGYRGPDCSLKECPSSTDPLGGEGGSAGRDCSGRGLCDYTTGLCKCFKGYTGESCNVQNTFA